MSLKGYQHLATQRISDNAGEAAVGNIEIKRTSGRVSQGTASTVAGVTQLKVSAEELSSPAVELSSIVDNFKVDPAARDLHTFKVV